MRKIKSKPKEGKPFRGTASFGKRQEFIAMAKLLEEDFDVYQTLVDDQQIDCVLRGHGEPVPKYADLQIKARSENAGQKSWGTWPSIKVPARENLFFLFYSQPLDLLWIVPSEDLAKDSSQQQVGKYAGNYTVTLATKTDDGVRLNPKFSRFLSAFQTLRDYLGEPPSRGKK